MNKPLLHEPAVRGGVATNTFSREARRLEHRPGRLCAILALVLCVGSANLADAQPAKLVKDIAGAAASSSPSALVNLKGTLLFGADDGTGHRGLWRSDGTASGTVLVLAGFEGDDLSPSSPLAVNGYVFFSSGVALWKTDGAAAGTTSLKYFGGSVRSANLTDVDGMVYFVNGGFESHLWKSDGTPTGTVLVAQTAGFSSTCGGPSSYIRYPTDVNGTLFFGAFENRITGVGQELWRVRSCFSYSLVRNINPDIRASGGCVSGSDPRFLTNVSGTLLFSADDGTGGRELWRSDGTEAGTVLVADLAPGSASSNPSFLVNANGTLFFAATNGSQGVELWRSDGTLPGTSLVADIRPGAASSSPADLIFANGALYFTADDGIHGRELWTSDGTALGTVIVSDIAAGPVASSPQLMTPARGLLHFTADDGTHGRELWSSDGTANGTGLVQDILPGSASSDPSTLTGAEAGLFFAADDGVHGRELWLLPLTPPASLTVSVDAARVKEGSLPGNNDTTPAVFTVALSADTADTVTVTYETRDGTASSAEDYQATSGVLTFAPGESRKRVQVTVVGDGRAESNEAFTLALTSSSKGVIRGGLGQGTILDDDGGSTVARAQPVWHEFFAVDTLETPDVGDFNGDGKTDIITFTRQNPAAFGDVYVALSDGVKFGVNTKWHDFFAINTAERVVIGDYDGDGKDDIATWLSGTTRQVYVARSTGTGMNQAAVWLQDIGFDSTDVLLSGDANGDGKADLILFARKPQWPGIVGRVYVALSDGSSFASPTTWHSFFAVSTNERPRVADLNGDGKVDIVTFATDSPTAFGDVYVAMSDGTKFGDGQNSAKWHDWFSISPLERIQIGDVNGDGRDDFFTILPLPWGMAFSIRSRGSSLGANVLWPEVVAPSSTDNVLVGDVNGDGKADIIVFAQGLGKVFVSLAP